MPNRAVADRAARELTIARYARRQARAARWLRDHGAHDHARALVASAVATVEAFRRGEITALH